MSNEAMLPPKSPPKKRQRRPCPAAGTSTASTHVVCLVDNSGSMECGNRLQMVFDAVLKLLRALSDVDGIVCSLVTFDDTFKVCFKRREVNQDLQSLVRSVCKATRPKGTGRYLQALAAFKSLVTVGMTVGILLSDGEPTEVIWEYRPASCIEEVMRAMRQEFGNMCILHTVGFGEFGMQCLQRLAHIGGGTFHDSKSIDAEKLRSIFGQLATSVSTLHGSLLAFGEEALTPIPAKELEVSPGSWRGSPEQLRQRARPCWAWLMVEEGGQLLTRGDARLMYLHHKPFAQGALRYAYHAQSAHGYCDDPVSGSRFHLVVKESKFAIKHKSPKDLHKYFLQNHRRAQDLAKVFNRALEALGAEAHPRVDFVPAYVVKISDESQDSGFRYVTAERYIPGSYVKFNGNDGFVSLHKGGEAEVAAGVAAAFSHFTLKESEGREICVDIQGVGTKWTDPQIHSVQKQFGVADLGQQGIDMFVASHRCGKLCQKLHLSTAARHAPTCVVCLDQPRQMLCQPCRHLCLCTGCAMDLQAVGDPKCPICRNPTTAVAMVTVEQSQEASSTYVRESELDRMEKRASASPLLLQSDWSWVP